MVDTEGGAPRMGGMAIANADLVITPLAASALEAREVFKAARLVEAVSRREGRPIPLIALFARTPGGVRRAFREISDALAEEGLRVLPTALSDKEAFRALFARGGSLDGLKGVSGLVAARALTQAYVDDVLAEVGSA